MSTLFNRRRALAASPVPRFAAAPSLPSPFDAALGFTIGYGVPGYGAEGGEADNPDDPGGLTWRGITLANFRTWRGDASATAAQLLAMPEAEIVGFYGCNYWNPVCGNALPPAVAVVVFDMAVNAGPGASARILQAAVGAVQDGSIGPDTLAAVAASNPTFLLGQVTQLRHAFYGALSGYPEFGQGWDARADACEAAAMALLPNVISTT